MSNTENAMKPQRIQLSRKKGWRLPPNTVKVDRTTVWGNPYVIGEPVDLKQAKKWGFNLKHTETQAADRADAVRRFAQNIAFDDASRYAIRNVLKGKNLACWCPLDQPCHADLLLKIANEETGDITCCSAF